MADASSGGAGGAIHLNLADADALVSGAGLDPAAARALIAGRPYASWTEVERLSGLGSEAVNALRSRGVELGAASEGPINEPGSGGSVDDPAGNLGHA
jgi:DNA uptake protein ComE-like DNA-binding protein